jgi:hypothetical protein
MVRIIGVVMFTTFVLQRLPTSLGNTMRDLESFPFAGRMVGLALETLVSMPSPHPAGQRFPARPEWNSFQIYALFAFFCG